MGARTVSSDEEDGEEYEERDEEDVRDHEARVQDEDDEEDDEEDEEGQDEYEKDDFIVDDVEEEEEDEEEQKESSDEEAKARKKKRKKREAEAHYELDEDDYELLQEAHGTGFHRPKSKQAGTTKFKRLKKAGRVGGEDSASVQRGFSDDDDDLEEGNRRGRTAEEELKRSLFGDDEGPPPEDLGVEEEQEEEDIGEEDEMADFIVDEEEMDENGQPVRRRKTKKKGPRPAGGISSIALQEAQEIFGDVEELLNRRKLGLRADRATEDFEMDEDEEGLRRPSQKKLEEEFEPSILEEKYMTAKDDHIRETDMPERFQLLEEVIGLIPTKEIEVKEAEWIYDRAFSTSAGPIRIEFRHLLNVDKAQIIQQINHVLTQIHDHKFEIPFIAMYRKEGCLDLVTEPIELQKEPKSQQESKSQQELKLKHYKALWEVQYWDKRWWLLQRRKITLQATYDKRARAEAASDPAKSELLDRLLVCLQDAESEQAVDDVDAKFHVFFPLDEVEVQQGQYKRPKLRSFYAICRKAGIRTIVKHFGLTPEQFGDNLQAMYKRHEVEDPSFSPEDIAKECTTLDFRDPQSVLRGARHMASVEISTEPIVRDYVRNIYMENAVVTTKPTKEGNAIIDAFHQYGNVKWLLNKPISAFNDAQWLLIQKGEEDKLLEVTVGLPQEVVNDTLIQEFEAEYLSDGVSRTAQLWNEQRKQILADALSTFLLPLMEKETKVMLTVRAKNWVARECSAALWKKVSVAPYPGPKSDPDERFEEETAPRVMACCWGPGKPATTFVMLDSSGEIVNTLNTPYLNSLSSEPHELERKMNDQQRLQQFMMENQPHVVVLGAASISCRKLKDYIFEAIFKIVEEHPRDLAEGLDTINVVYGDEALPNLYENSRVSLEQLPGQRGIVRRAVALGRYLQNPLAMVASLCGMGREILSLKIHKLQNFLSDDELFEAIEQVMITVTNQVGVDVNLAAAHEWLFAPLQFVSGLGPRKASMMQRLIQGAGRISTRKEMLTSLRLMKRNVFINACGFLRIRGSGQAASGNQILDPLDDTRIHPESYDLAKKMAEDIYCEDQGQIREDMDEEMLEMAIEHVKENPNLIKNLDIVEYAGILQDRDGVYKLETLKDIQMELLHGYQEWRVPYLQPSQDEEFTLLTGEDNDTLAEGRVVNAKVTKVQSGRVTCLLESGLQGVIQKEDLSDTHDVEPMDKVSKGSIITCRVKHVQKARYMVDLTCRGSELRADHWDKRRPKDKYYVQDHSHLQIEDKERKEREEKNKSFKPRMIVHPQFQNISLADAIEALKDKDVGDCIIRPSSRGPTHLSLTLKIFDQVYSHINIEEGGKDGKDFTSFLRLGKTLKIQDETFEDLDEVIARYVDPLVANIKAVLTYRKFRAGTKSQIDDSLRQEKLQIPNRICYCLSVAYDHPGAFMLSYIRNVTIHHEYISIYHKGFKFRSKMFEILDKLIFYFQKHVNDPIGEPPPRAVAARVPMRSPAPRGLTSGMWNESDRPGSAASTGKDANRGPSDMAPALESRSIGKLDNLGSEPDILSLGFQDSFMRAGGRGGWKNEHRGGHGFRGRGYGAEMGDRNRGRGRSRGRWGSDGGGGGRGGRHSSWGNDQRGDNSNWSVRENNDAENWGSVRESNVTWGVTKVGNDAAINADDGWGKPPDSGKGTSMSGEDGWGRPPDAGKGTSMGGEDGWGRLADAGNDASIDGEDGWGKPVDEHGWNASKDADTHVKDGGLTSKATDGWGRPPVAGGDGWPTSKATDGWGRPRDAGKDGGPTSKASDGWGRPRDAGKSGWGRPSDAGKDGWPTPKATYGGGRPQGTGKDGWGRPSDAGQDGTPTPKATDGWGRQNDAGKDGWGRQPDVGQDGGPTRKAADGWGRPAEDAGKDGWGRLQDGRKDGWGTPADAGKDGGLTPKATDGWGRPPDTGKDGWGTPADAGKDGGPTLKATDGWGRPPDTGKDGWDRPIDAGQDGGPTPKATDGWSRPAEGAGKDGWDTPKATDGWGRPQDAGNDGWGRPQDAGNDGWGRPQDAGNDGWGRPQDAGKDGWGRPQDAGNDGWGRPQDAGKDGWGRPPDAGKDSGPTPKATDGWGRPPDAGRLTPKVAGGWRRPPDAGNDASMDGGDGWGKPPDEHGWNASKDVDTYEKDGWATSRQTDGGGWG